MNGTDKKINTKKYLIVFPFKKNILFVTKISLKKFREIENILYDFPVIFLSRSEIFLKNLAFSAKIQIWQVFIQINYFKKNWTYVQLERNWGDDQIVE